MRYLCLLLSAASLVSAGVPVIGVPKQDHEKTIQDAVSAQTFRGTRPPVVAGFDGDGAMISGWTQSGANKETRPGLLDAARTAGAEIDQTKASAGLVHARPRSNGHAWATGPNTKISARIDPGGSARLTVTQPNGEVTKEDLAGKEPSMRMSRTKLRPVVDNKQTRTYKSNTPGKQVNVKAHFTSGQGSIKAKAWQRR